MATFSVQPVADIAGKNAKGGLGRDELISAPVFTDPSTCSIKDTLSVFFGKGGGKDVFV